MNQAELESHSTIIDGMTRRELWQYVKLLACTTAMAVSVAFLPKPYAIATGILLAVLVWLFGYGCCSEAVDDTNLLAKLCDSLRDHLRENQLAPLNNVLYRLYDKDGDLLYIGITSDVVARMAGHRGDKSWWNEVADKKFEYFKTRAELEAVERLAIIREKPLYNVIHHPDRPQPLFRRAKPRKQTPVGKPR
jgi:predicted GIY-YIG superfamily endonuclease